MPKENRSGVIYQIPCSRCPQTYIGQTGRTLGQRLKEHQRAVRDRNTSTSALADHVCSTGHPVEWNRAQIIDSCPHTSKRCLLEWWMIQKEPSPWTENLGHYRLYIDSFSDLHTLSILCTYFALFSCTLVNCKLVFPTLFIHYHISYYYSYITTHHPLSHHPPHHLLSHHLLYNPHTPTLYSQPVKKTAADCRNVWFNNISWLVNCTELKPDDT